MHKGAFSCKRVALSTTDGKYQQTSVQPPNIQFNENLYSKSRLVTIWRERGERERCEANRHILELSI
jgi:hypothetical protein